MLLPTVPSDSAAFTAERSSRPKGLYDPKAFFTHAALLRQGFPHWQYSSLLPPVGVWTVFQFQCG